MVNKHKKGIAIEYALIMMVIITAFLVTLFATIKAFGVKSGKYTTYVSQKMFIDKVGDAIIDNKVNGATNDISAMMQNNTYKLEYNDYSSYILITKDSKVYLMITFTTSGGKTAVKSYTYGIYNG